MTIIERVREAITTYPGAPAVPSSTEWEASINHNDGDKLLALHDAVRSGNQADIDKAMDDLAQQSE